MLNSRAARNSVALVALTMKEGQLAVFSGKEVVKSSRVM